MIIRPILTSAVIACLTLAAAPGFVRADGDDASESVVAVLPNDAVTSAMDDIAAMRHWRDVLVEHGFLLDRCGVSISDRSMSIEIESPGQRAFLESSGFVLTSAVGSPSDAASPRGSVDAQYYDPDEIADLLTQIALDHPDITRVFSLGTTLEGRDIPAIEISDHPGDAEDEPSILLNGLHHAREVATPHIVLDAVQQLTDGYAANDATIVSWVRDYKTVCVPVVNPDGSARVFSGDIDHRKNLRDVCTATNPGVDLNRNYPYHWGSGAAACERGSGSSGTFCSDSYRGTGAASEPESLAMIALANAYRFTIVVSYHSYGEFIDYPYACNDGNPDNRMPEHPVIDAMMRSMATAIQGVNGRSYAVNSPIAAGAVNGDDTSWYYAHEGAYPFIVEVGTQFQPAFSAVTGIVSENRAGWRSLFSRLGAARIDVHVQGGCEPLDAEVTLLNYVFDTDELPRITTPPFGRWTFLVPPNSSYTVRVSKAGYVTQDRVVVVGNSLVNAVFSLASADAPAFILPGDMNGDCTVDGADFQPFVEAVISGLFASPMQVARGDFDANCTLDTDDVVAFVTAALQHDVCP